MCRDMFRKRLKDIKSLRTLTSFCSNTENHYKRKGFVNLCYVVGVFDHDLFIFISSNPKLNQANTLLVEYALTVLPKLLITTRYTSSALFLHAEALELWSD